MGTIRSRDGRMTNLSTKKDSLIVDFTYSVKWSETSTPFERRMDKFSRYSFLPQHLEVGLGFMV